MDLTQLIEALSDPAAYPDPVGKVDVRQTHISAVFLAGHFVYKVKKPVELGFLDSARWPNAGTTARRRCASTAAWRRRSTSEWCR